MLAATGDETTASEDTGSTPSVVNISRDPRRSRPVQTTNVVTAPPAAPAVKTELPKPKPPLKQEPLPQEPLSTEPVKPDVPLTPKSPTSSSASIVLPPLPAYQL